MIRLIYFVLFFILESSIGYNLLAQKEDYNWIIGTGGKDNRPNEPYGNFIMSFENENFLMKRIVSEAKMYDCNSIISDHKGEIRLYSNGCRVFGNNNKVISGLEEINRDSYWWRGDGHRVAQSELILEDPSDKKQFYIIYCFDDLPITDTILQSNILRASLVNFTNLDMPEIIFKDKFIHSEKFAWGEITSTRHANGRDWWIVIPKRYSKDLLIYLLDPSGINFHHEQKFDLPSASGGIGQACFSPNGSYYALGNIFGKYRLGGYLELFDFDRCNGILSHKRVIPVSDSSSFGGLVFSSNNKYLFFATQYVLRRIDVTIEDLKSSSIKIDTFLGDKSDAFRCSFDKMVLGPDGNIYMASAGSNRCMSSITNPDEDNIAQIGWEQNGIQLLTYNFRSIPNLPNFRLGPIDGSECDSLGINNIPLARFRHRQDSIDILKFQFTDLSSYEVKEWHWDFGDGNQSRDENPIHQYSKQGLYHVCLKVKNENGEDLKCKDIYLGVNSLKQTQKEIGIDIWNEGNQLIIQVNNYYPKNLRLQLFNLQGKLIEEKRLYYGLQTFSVEHYSQGIYYYQMEDQGVKVKSGKVIKAD